MIFRENVRIGNYEKVINKIRGNYEVTFVYNDKFKQFLNILIQKVI